MTGKTLQVEQVDREALELRKVVNTILAKHFSRFMSDVIERIEVGNQACSEIIEAFARHRPATDQEGREQQARELIYQACDYCGVQRPNGYQLMGPFDDSSDPWQVAIRAVQAALAQSSLSNEGVREALEAWSNSIIMSDEGRPIPIRDIGMGYGGDVQRAAQLTRQALASLQPASLSEERMALEDARPLIESIAAWERKNGTIAAIMPHEYAAFMETLKKEAVHGSARAALARGKKNG